MTCGKYNAPKVSVITVVYNAVDKIESTVRSVLGQDYGNLEYIVVDGGSTDGTLDILDLYRDKINVFISEKDDGIYDAFNKGILNANGEWIAIMNAGDTFMTNNVLSAVFGADKRYDGIDVVYGDAVSVDGDVEEFCKASGSISDMKRGPCYRQGASFVRRSVHLQYMFDLGKKDLLEFALDYEQMYRMYIGGVSFMRIPLSVLRYELRGVSTVSPFKITYYNYLISHGMKCGVVTRFYLAWITLVRGGRVVLSRFCARRRK